MKPDNPLIFDIAKGSFVDGAGIRTVIFFKGCPLRCQWCQNPESQNPEPEILHFPEKCIECGNCSNGKSCYTDARKTIGRYYSPEELIKIILQDKAYYEASEGGVTLSGGEPASFPKYLNRVLPELKNKKINIAIQTSGFFDYTLFETYILPYIDTVFYDIKILDPEKHKKYTGVSNEIIIENFLKLLGSGIEINPRVPLVPNITATKENLAEISNFLRNNNIRKCELLPYNTAGLSKLKRLGRKIPKDIAEFPMSAEEEIKWQKMFISSK